MTIENLQWSGSTSLSGPRMSGRVLPISDAEDGNGGGTTPPAPEPALLVDLTASPMKGPGSGPVSPAAAAAPRAAERAMVARGVLAGINSQRPESFRTLPRLDKLEELRIAVGSPGSSGRRVPLNAHPFTAGLLSPSASVPATPRAGGAEPTAPPSDRSLSTRAPSRRGRARRFWCSYKDLNIRTKQILALVVLVCVAAGSLVGMHVGLLVQSTRRDLELHAESEVRVMDLMYSTRIETARAVFEGHATLEVIRAAAAAGAAGGAAGAAARAAAAAFLKGECERVDLEYGTLVLKDGMRVLAGCNRDRTGEGGFDPGGVASRALQAGQAMWASALIGADEAAKEGFKPSGRTGPVLFRLAAVPVTLPGASSPEAVLVAGISSSADHEVASSLAFLRDGYVGMYAKGDDGTFALVGSYYKLPNAPAAAGASISETGAGVDLLQRTSGAETVLARFDLRDNTMTWAARPISSPSGAPLGLLVRGKLHTEAYELLRNTFLLSLLVAGPILILAVVLAVLLARAVSAPILELQRSVEGFLRTGGVEEIARAPLKSRDEIGKLARAFSRMADRVKHVYEQQVEAQQEVATEAYRTRRIMDTANDAIFLIDAGCRVRSMNHQAELMFGYAPEDLLGENISHIMPPAVAVQHDSLVKRYLHTGQARLLGRLREETGRRKSGVDFPVELSIAEMRINGEVFFVGMIRDISDRKAMETALERERQRTEALLRNMLPACIAERLKENNLEGTPLPNVTIRRAAPINLRRASGERRAIADRVENVSVMFADIVNFTPLAGSMDAAHLVALLNDIFSEFDSLAEKYGLEKIKTLGDAFMCAGGVPPESAAAPEAEPHVLRMVRMALEMHDAIQAYRSFDGRPFRIRIGIHIGTVIAGVIGKKKFLYDLWGDTVNVASRMESSGMPGKTQVSREVHEALAEAAGLRFEDRGEVFIKGKGHMRTYFVHDAEGDGAGDTDEEEREAAEALAEVDANSSIAGGRAFSDALSAADRRPGPKVDDAAAEAAAAPRPRPPRSRSLASLSFRNGAPLESHEFAIVDLPASAYPALMHRMLGRLGLLEACKPGSVELSVFVREALAGYRPSSPFHNCAHAVDVAHMVFYQLHALRAATEAHAHPLEVAPLAQAPSPPRVGGWRRIPPLDHVDMYALLVAALCHDLDHPGLTNLFLIKSRSPMALLYANSSPLERHHASRFLSLLQRDDTDICAGLSAPDRQRFTQLAVDCILSTDMLLHGDYMAAFAARFGGAEPARDVPLGAPGARLAHLDDRTLFAAMLLKCADLANAARTFENSQHWAAAIQTEFFEQGALEQELGLEVSPGMAPTTEPDLGSSARQVFFLANIVQPLYQAVADVVPEMGAPLVASIRSNVQKWRDLNASLGKF